MTAIAAHKAIKDDRTVVIDSIPKAGLVAASVTAPLIGGLVGYRAASRFKVASPIGIAAGVGVGALASIGTQAILQGRVDRDALQIGAIATGGAAASLGTALFLANRLPRTTVGTSVATLAGLAAFVGGAWGAGALANSVLGD